MTPLIDGAALRQAASRLDAACASDSPDIDVLIERADRLLDLLRPITHPSPQEDIMQQTTSAYSIPVHLRIEIGRCRQAMLTISRDCPNYSDANRALSMASALEGFMKHFDMWSELTGLD